ncbi:hypothetical protein [Dyadobacter arcticus]|uniref:Uncharacterized protein n=1 Tax=Dyadobacter arcticus TaxID=1078754 RepID=A0ABX0UFL0_9BACT|nr:hypothetical protein [Dyadobacter arcticus]NIJ51702.1 hypothetical protein [Dyadobacter arcticus]
MEDRKIKFDGLPEMTESELCKYVFEKTRGRDLFPEKTARARQFLEGLEKSQQKLIP